ncbi:MAG: primosomal protein N' [Clostridium sp.]|nr:primosomal protein N' [Clostridium sp.]MCM1547290.1 primosomal protein N' [Ruminococcus sp.]
MKALVAVSNASFAFDKPFSYRIPKTLVSEVTPGTRVVVPFGRSNKKRTGIVLETAPMTADDETLKSIVSAPDGEPVLNSEMLELVLWLRDNTFCTYYDAVKCMVPSGMNINIDEKYSLTGKIPDNLTEKQSEVYKRIAESGDIDSEISELKKEGFAAEIDILALRGSLKCDVKSNYKVGGSVVLMMRLSDGYRSDPDSFLLTAKQKQLADILAENENISLKEACYLGGVGKSVAKKLIEKGAALEYETESYRAVTLAHQGQMSAGDIILSEAQSRVFETVKRQIDIVRPECFLLHGVTGSGKTSVFKKLIAHCISLGRQALLMIPEISLTPQMVAQFQELFGETVAVIHSGLSKGQRMDEYKRIKRGLAKIAVGTRSAVFAPFDNIGLIIVDEEGERSYKSDSSPRYSAVEVAKKRCRTHNSVLLLASATPSVESYYYAQRGIYKLLEMKERYSGAELPKVGIVDMNLEREEGNTSEFSSILIDEINENLKNHEQTILLLNRRGYHTIISCAHCHTPVYCPNCSIPLTYHKVNDTLMCHYCGHTQPKVEACPACGVTNLKQMGFGTQKLEEQLSELFPYARVLRMDADTTMSRYSYEKNFKAFGHKKYDIMIGTQMIGKGLDFPDVTLVGVLSVDKALFAGDFRSYERTFSLVAQVVGRCGRGGRPGRAYLQTFMPEHYVLNLAAKQDYKGFYNEEAAIRRALIFPPICDICVFGISSEDDKKASETSDKLLEIIKEHVNNGISFPIRVLGPVRCSYGKINGKYRWRVILKCKNTSDLRDFVRSVLYEINRFADSGRVNIYADINGDIGV